MKSLLVGVTAAALVSSAAYADSHNPAVKSSKPVATHVAAKGHNSFTEAQARGRIEKAGYSHVGKLTKNHNGIWQGPASKDGHKVNIGLDYKGNVILR